MTFAFSRDGAIPGSRIWSKLDAAAGPGQRGHRASAVAAAIVTLPALIEVNIGTEEAPLIIPVAFYAVTSIAVIGLYLGVRDPDLPALAAWATRSRSGAWNNGAKYKWMNPIAVAEIVIVSLYLMMPTLPGGNPFSERVRVEVRQLRADRHRWARCSCWRSGGTCRPRSGSRAEPNIDPAVAEVYDD